jgi:hypothetical protein
VLHGLADEVLAGEPVGGAPVQLGFERVPVMGQQLMTKGIAEQVMKPVPLTVRALRRDE